MFDAETVLRTLYVEVDTIGKQEPALQAHAATWSAESLSLSEVATLALFGQFACFASERAFYRYAQAHLRPLFPRLPERSQFTRLQRHAHAVLVALGQVWAQAAERMASAAGEGGAGAFEAVDTLGGVVRNVQRRGAGHLAGQAERGHCTREGWYEGLRLLTCVTPSAAITGYGIAAGNAKEQPMADTFLGVRAAPTARLPQVGVSTSGGCYLTDTGLEGQRRHQAWARLGAHVIPPPKRVQQAERWPKRLRRWLGGWRQIVESVPDDLLFSFRLAPPAPAPAGRLSRATGGQSQLAQLCSLAQPDPGASALGFR